MNADDTDHAKEHARLWMKGLYRALISSGLDTPTVNALIQRHSHLLKEQS